MAYKNEVTGYLTHWSTLTGDVWMIDDYICELGFESEDMGEYHYLFHRSKENEIELKYTIREELT